MTEIGTAPMSPPQTQALWENFSVVPSVRFTQKHFVPKSALRTLKS